MLYIPRKWSQGLATGKRWVFRPRAGQGLRISYRKDRLRYESPQLNQERKKTPYATHFLEIHVFPTFPKSALHRVSCTNDRQKCQGDPWQRMSTAEKKNSGGGRPSAGRPPLFFFLPWSSSAFPLAFLFGFHTEIHGNSLLIFLTLMLMLILMLMLMSEVFLSMSEVFLAMLWVFLVMFGVLLAMFL